MEWSNLESLVVSDLSEWCDWCIETGGFWYDWLIRVMYWDRWVLLWVIDKVEILRLVGSDVAEWLVYWHWWFLMCLCYVNDVMTLVASDVSDWRIETGCFWCGWMMWLVYWHWWFLMCLFYVNDVMTSVASDVSDWRIEIGGFWYDLCDLCIVTGGFWYERLMLFMYWDWWFLIWLIDVIDV